MKNLEQELRNYYRSKHLASDKITAIQTSTQKMSRTHRRISYLLPVAALVLLTIGIGLWLHISTGSITRQVVTEIADNHLQHGALVVESDKYGVVQAALSELNFPIRPRRGELVQDFVLVGGKYCTIQGFQAAQLKLRHRKSQIIHTLYVLPIADGIKDVEPGIYETNGLQIELWADQFILYGLAHGQ